MQKMPYYAVYIPVKGGVGPTNAATVGVGGGGGGGAPPTAHSAASGIAYTTASTDAVVNSSGENAFVFREKSEALDFLKGSKDARLREFPTEEDALKYSQTGYELLQTKYADVRTSTAAIEKAAFRTPTKQELIEFRKIIEAGDYERVKAIIWENPRYLISSGDTPTTLKEGYRYNAMHVCALSKRPRIAELILRTVSDPKFVDLVLGKRADQKTCREMCVNLLDYYLNIPEKGRSETPLHLAVKFGCLEMAEVLTSYPECKMAPNSEGALPKDIICSRMSQAPLELHKQIEALLDERFYVPVLRSLDSAIPPQIGEPFSANNPPHLNSDPMTPEVKIEALAGPMNKEDAKKFHRRWKTPPRIGSNVSSPITNNPFISPMKSRGNINNTPTKTTRGAAVDDGANSVFSSSTATGILQRRTLFNSTPARSYTTVQNGLSGVATATGSIATNLDKKTAGDSESALADKQNGNHKPGDANEVAVEYNNNNNNQEVELEVEAGEEEVDHAACIGAQGKPAQMSMLKSVLFPKTPLRKMKKDLFFTYREQHAPSPVAFSALTEADGNDSNDSLANERDICDTPGYKERHIKNTDTEKGLEIIGRELAKEQNIGWREYWDFLNVFVDIASEDGLQKLEHYFGQRIKAMEMSKRAALAVANSVEIMDSVTNALERLDFTKDANTAMGRNGFNSDGTRYELLSSGVSDVAGTASPAQPTTPYTCVEKSLQVFAKRMTKTIIHNIENVVSINDTLLSELKRLKSLICSFKEDSRFLNVNFAKVHSRIGNLISIYLENSEEVTPPVKLKIQVIIQTLLLTPGDRRDHIGCVCGRILYMLEYSAEKKLPENLKTEEMCSQMWSQENHCDCQWETNLSRKTSRRNRIEARYKSHQHAKQLEIFDKQVKKLADARTDAYGMRVQQSGNDSSDDLDDDVFWSDLGGSDTEEDDDRWFTPPESPSRISSIEDRPDSDHNKIYVYGTEPTKRDLDVLNAIFHIDIDKTKYPNVHSWKSTLLSYPNEEMDYFPSPSVVRKSHSFVVQNSGRNEGPIQSHIHQQQPKAQFMKPNTTKPTIFSQMKKLEHQQQQPQLPAAKRLFMSPKLSKRTNLTAITATTTTTTTTTSSSSLSSSLSSSTAITTAISIVRNNDTTITTTAKPATIATTKTTPQHQQSFVRPLNKLRGLFSAYRERLDSSPMSATSVSPTASYLSDRSGSDASNNLSLLNISASE